MLLLLYQKQNYGKEKVEKPGWRGVLNQSGLRLPI